MLVPRQLLQRSSSVWCACKWYCKPCGEKYVRVQPAIVHAMLSLAPFRLGARDAPWCNPPSADRQVQPPTQPAHVPSGHTNER